MRISIILLISFILTIVLSQLLPSSLPLLLPEGKRPGILKGEVNDLLYFDASYAIAEISKGNGCLVDVRDKEDFRNLHPTGAINIPYHESETLYNELHEKVTDGKRIFILCEGKLCDMSARVARRLSGQGYKNITIIRQNFAEWIRMNLPTEKGGI